MIRFIPMYEGVWSVTRNDQPTGWMLFRHGADWLVTGPNGHRREFAEKFRATEYVRARIAHPAGSLA